MSDPTSGERTDRAIRASAAYQAILDWQATHEKRSDERHTAIMTELHRLNGNPAVAIGNLARSSYKSLVAVAALSGVAWLYLSLQQIVQQLRHK